MKSTPRPRQALRPLAFAATAAALLALSGWAQATPTLYTDPAAFAAAVASTGASPGTDSFETLPAGITPAPLPRSAGSQAYTIAVLPDPSGYDSGAPIPPGLVYAAGAAGDVWLSTNTATDTLRFTDLGGANAIGGWFFGSDVDGLFQPGATLTLLASDDSGQTSYTLTGASPGSFVGFVSAGALGSLDVSTAQPAFGSVWTTVNDLTLAGPVPEPQTAALWLAGLACLGTAARRRRAR
jgi:hypothetical protein